MTEADDQAKKDPKPDGETGTALAPAAGEPSGVDPFIAAAAEAPAAPEPRPLYSKALDYGAHAAMIVGLVGFAWTVSSHVVDHHGAPTATPAKLADTGTMTPTAKTDLAASATPKPDEMGELRKANQTMANEIRNLHASLEALRATVVRERSASMSGAGDTVRQLSASLDSVKSSLAGTRSEQGAAIAQLTARIEKLQREAKAPAQPAAERVSDHAADRVPERSSKPRDLDTATTASIPAPVPAKAVPTPPSKPTVLASIEPVPHEAESADKPQVISGWVVRDVYQGVALIEGRRGQMEVVPGVSIPGAGVVKSIERHNGAWAVTTSKGQLAYAAPQREQQHESHRGYQRDYYGPSRWGY